MRYPMSRVERLEDYLLYNDTELLEKLKDVSLVKIREQRKDVVKAQCPSHATVLELRQSREAQRRPRISTTLPTLDQCLKSGLPRGSVTELVGPATVGKSQFCFSIAIQEAAPQHCAGNGGRVIYFDTEGKFSAKRMAQIIKSRWSSSVADIDDLTNSILDRVWIVRAENTMQLMRHFQGLETSVSRNGASLVVVDSIAAILRAEFGRDEIIERQRFVGEQATLLKYIAHVFDIPVLVTNQVTSPLDGPSTNIMGDSTTVLYDGVIPALGTKWAHCVNTRISLERTAHRSKRTATIRKSPLCANDYVSYKITDLGVEEDVA